MAGITLTHAQAQLDAFLDASLKIAKNQEYEFAGRRYRRADLNYVNEQIRYWDGMVRRLSGSRRSIIPQI